MLRRNGPVIKSVELVLRLRGNLWWKRFLKEVGLEPGVKERGSYGWWEWWVDSQLHEQASQRQRDWNEVDGQLPHDSSCGDVVTQTVDVQESLSRNFATDSMLNLIAKEFWKIRSPFGRVAAMVTVTDAVLLRDRRSWDACLSFWHHWARRWTWQSVTHGQCNARPTVTFPATGHCHCALVGTHFPSCSG